MGAAPACGSGLRPPALSFAKRVYIDKVRPGGEPVSVVAHDGSISVSAHDGIFIAATSGPKMVSKPLRTRPTRPTRPSCTVNPLC